MRVLLKLIIKTFRYSSSMKARNFDYFIENLIFITALVPDKSDL